MIYSILFVQFTCLTVFSHNLSPGPLWSSSWSGALYFILRAFLHPIIIFFLQQIPYHRSLFCCYTNVMSSIPNLSVSSLLGNITEYNMVKYVEQDREAQKCSYLSPYCDFAYCALEVPVLIVHLLNASLLHLLACHCNCVVRQIQRKIINSKVMICHTRDEERMVCHARDNDRLSFSTQTVMFSMVRHRYDVVFFVIFQ